MKFTRCLAGLLLALTVALPQARSQRELAHADLSSKFNSSIYPQLTWEQAYALAKIASDKLSFFEKISLTTGTGLSLGRCSGNVAKIDHIGFGYFCLNDGPTALRGTDKVTVFPAGVTTASTWDRELMYIRSRAMGIENRIKGVNVALAPVAGGLGRAPQAGRNWEGFGPDPFLAGIGNAESVKGLQDAGVIACVKHWIGNEQERYRLVIENFLSGTTPPITKSISSNIPDRALREIYEWPFVDAVKAGVASVMCAYQQVNNTYSCESIPLIREHLKSQFPKGLGFRGFVMTDWFASAGAIPAAEAGIDMVMPGDVGAVGIAAGGMPASDGAVEKGKGSRLDEMVIRVLASWYKLGQDKGFPETSFNSWNQANFGILVDRGFAGIINKHVPANPPLHAKIVRRIAAEGTVLLKNLRGPSGKTGLPLPKTIKKIGIFGSDAGPIPGGPNSCGSFGACAHGTLAVGWGSGAGTFDHLIDPLQSLTLTATSLGATVETVLNDYAYSTIKTKSQNQDACLVFLKSNSGEGLANVEGNVGDRMNLTAWRDGDKLVTTVSSTCRNTIVIVHSVGPITMEQWIENENVTAVLMAHLPGQESGTSLTDVLWGDTNPSGKLPYTIGKFESNYCCKVQSEYTTPTPQQDFKEGLLIDYMWFDKKRITPRFEFGYGLSFTNFTYHNDTMFVSTGPGLASAVTTEVEYYNTPAFTVSIDVSNTGGVDGKEVVQLYVGFPGSETRLDEPVRRLRGFEKVVLVAGQRKTVLFELTRRDISVWDVVTQQWVVTPGEYNVWIGASSRDLRARRTVKV